MSTFIPADKINRDRIAGSLAETLFVEAGAGTGKTSALVARIANLIRYGYTSIDRIAAITFTEAAAAELRERVRQSLEESSENTDLSEPERSRCRQALRSMEGASIQTLHSFAGAILRERPLEAGLPPAFEIVEDIEADLSFEEQWQRWLDGVLQSEQTVPSLRKALALGLGLDHLKTIALAFHGSYDLLPECFPPSPTPVPAAVSEVIASSGRIRSLIPLAVNGPADPLADYAERVVELAQRLAEIEACGGDALPTLANWGKLSTNRGKQGDWETDPDSGLNACKVLKGLLKDLDETASVEIELARRAALIPLLDALRQFVLDYAGQRKSEGKAEFHDLLVWARDLLLDNPDACRHFQQRFSHILIDEFQDTDPIQADIAFALCRAEEANSSTKNGEEVRLVPGKLFVVGDPKQSIYRFRRADLATMQQVRRKMACETLDLCQNFRSQAPILEWVNHVFSEWMVAAADDTQAAYSGLIARWTPPPATPPLGVHCFGGSLDEKAAALRRKETKSVARVIAHIKAAGWKVRRDRDGELRDSAYQDICILLPARTGLPSLERELEDAGVPYRVESQSLILGTQEIREVLSCLRAIDSPADQVALIAALRSSAFSLSDTELLEFSDAGGRFDYIAPGKAGGPVKEALDELLRYHRERLWLPIDELVELFIRERRLLETCYGIARPRERMRRLQFIIERARAFAQAGSNSLRSFLDWIERQAEEQARMVEIPVPECDEDAVRIMTVHGSKGLEFPIVVLANLNSRPQNRTEPVIFDRRGGCVEVSTGSSGAFCTAGYAEAKECEQAAQAAENVRLMYVAGTRAMDHLVISLFHKEGDEKSPAAVIQAACNLQPGLWRPLDAEALPQPPGTSLEQPTAGDGPADSEEERENWIAHRKSVLVQAAEPAAIAATTVTRTRKDESERGEVHYRRGRGGTALGRAVHSVLQSVELDAEADIEAICKAQTAAEGIAEKWKDAVKLARNALAAEVVRRAAASGKYYREVFISAPFEGRLVEGYIDLLFEEDDGFVIADYKTDVIAEDDELPQHYDKYKLQAGIYAFALSEVTAKPVKQVVLVFLRSGKEVVIEDIAALMPAAEESIRQALGLS